MGFEVLLSAMYLDDENYIDTLNIHTDCVVINQCDRETMRDSVHNCEGTDVNVRYIETKERGLSRSRNMAVKNARSSVCILCDNDVEYVPGYDRIINSAFERHPDADVIVFFIKRPERQSPVFDSEKRMGYLSVLKIFSPEIAFRRDSISGIRFNEMFGAGAKYFLGEENIFLYDCLKKGLKIMYVPEMIAAVREEESTWFKGFNREFFVSRGANYAAMSRLFSFILILQYAVRKRKYYLDNLSMTAAMAAMFKGRAEYIRGRS